MLQKIIVPLMVCATISQAEIFSIEVTNVTSGISYQEGYSNVSDTFEALDTDVIKSQIAYSDADAIDAKIDFRGLDMFLAYTANSTNLILSIPSLDITETFSGVDRDGSVDELSDWLKKNGAATVERIMKKLAEVSPVDPVAGNPNSMIGSNVSNDFNAGFMNVATKQESQTVMSDIKNKNTIMIAPTYSSLDVDNKNSESYMLPLSYSFSFDRDALEKITFSLPITYTNVEDAVSGSLSVVLSYSKPINQDWILTPSVGYGISGSADLGSLAQVISTSLTSSYKWDLPSQYTLSMGNMIGYYATVKFYDADYAYNPGIKSITYRNALMLNMPLNNIINDTSLEVFVIDTRYTGSALYMQEYQEYGFSYGYDAMNLNILSDNEKYSVRKSLKVGFSYLDSSKANGFKVNLGFVF